MSSVGGIGGGAAGIGTLQDILALRQQIIGKSQLLQQVHAPQGPVASGVAGLPGSTEAGGTGSGGMGGSVTTTREGRCSDAKNASTGGQIVSGAPAVNAWCPSAPTGGSIVNRAGAPPAV